MTTEVRTSNPPCDADPWTMARRHRSERASRTSLADDLHARFAICQPELTVNVPVRPDDGSVRIFTGFRVQHTVSRGPANAGLGDAPTGSIDDVRALALWMSWKCAPAGSPFGGEQGGATCDPRTGSLAARERLTPRFATGLTPILGEEIDLPAPDLGTGPQQPAWFNETRSMHLGRAEPGVVPGKPMGIGGSEGRGEASGRGVHYFSEWSGERPAFPLATARVVVQGLGNVGATTATLGAASGATGAGVSDSDDGISNPDGTGPDRIGFNALADHVQRHGSVAGLPGASGANEILTHPCDLLVPATVEVHFPASNANDRSCHIIHYQGGKRPDNPGRRPVSHGPWDHGRARHPLHERRSD